MAVMRNAKRVLLAAGVACWPITWGVRVAPGARAQGPPTLDAAADAACARYLYSAIAPIAERGRRRWEPEQRRGAAADERRYATYRAQQRAVLGAVARAESCARIRVELRAAAAEGASARLREWPEGRLGALIPLLEGRCAENQDVVCEPAHPDVRRLRPVFQGPYRARGYYRAFVVVVVDALARSPALVPAAQLLWTFATWDFSPPSRETLEMLSDLRSRRARTQGSYPRSGVAPPTP